MRWKAKPYFGTWRRWFAWYPVKVDGEIVWLERIERCPVSIVRRGPLFDVEYDYRNI